MDQMIDRMWLEQRIYDIEEEMHETLSTKSTFDRAAELFASLRFSSSSKIAIVVLGNSASVVG